VQGEENRDPPYKIWKKLTKGSPAKKKKGTSNIDGLKNSGRNCRWEIKKKIEGDGVTTSE